MLRCATVRAMMMDYKATLNLPQTDFPMKANLPQREPEVLARWERERLGGLGGWHNPYLTMTHDYEAAVLREVGKFVKGGGVYKGKKPVLWCPVDETALAEAEVEYEEHTSPSIYVKFPLENSPQILASRAVLGVNFPSDVKTVSIVIWTTTPWTLPANQAVCLHPDFDYAFVRVGDEVLVIAEKLVDAVAKACGLSRYDVLGVRKGQMQLGGFEGLRCRRPASEGTSPILLGEFVTLEQGTGCVHIAPGHGQEDYELALKYNDPRYQAEIQTPLEVLAPVDDQGRFTDEAPEWQGKTVFEANPLIVQKLKASGVLLGEGTLTHTYPHCWRCKNPVIFRATDQWFVSMEKNDLRTKALEQIAIVRWLPPRGRDRIYGMIQNRPDWCLSRQRVWGVPIPGFACQGCGQVLITPAIVEHGAKLDAQHGTDVGFEREAGDLLPAGTTCPKCGGLDFDKERDILDVWFESGVSHAAVLKPRGKAAGQDWWPADLYLEGSDQHRGWFHSTLRPGITTPGRAPQE